MMMNEENENRVGCNVFQQSYTIDLTDGFMDLL